MDDFPNPTAAQKLAGNYGKGHVRVNGMLVSIESPQGATRSGTNDDGTDWSGDMANHYGYIRGTQGRDKDHIDAFLGPMVGSASTPVHVIDQNKPDGSFDEHKVMLGFPDQQSAVQAYHDNYPDDWKGFGAVSSMPLDTFKRWAFADGRRVKPAADHSITSQGYAQGGSVAYADGGSTDAGSTDPAWVQQVADFGPLSNLPPDLWAQLQSQLRTAGDAGVTYGGYNIAPEVVYGTGENGGDSSISGYSVSQVGNSGAPGTVFGQFSPDGQYTGTRTVQTHDDSLWQMAFLAALTGGIGLDSGLFGNLFGAGSGSSAAGYVNGSDLMSDAFDANGGFGAGGFGSTGANPATFYDYVNGSDLASDQYSLNPASDYNYVNGSDLASDPVNPASAIDYRNGSDVMSDNFDAKGGGGPGGFGGQPVTTPPTPPSIKPPTSLPPFTPSINDLSKLLPPLVKLLDPGNKNNPGTNDPATKPPFDPGAPWYMPPGWRTDRPMYVPGSDAVPTGWLGAGGQT